MLNTFKSKPLDGHLKHTPAAWQHQGINSATLYSDTSTWLQGYDSEQSLYHYYTCLRASMQDNTSKTAPERQTILNFTAERDDGSGSGNCWNSKTCATICTLLQLDHRCQNVSSAKFFHRPDVFPAAQSTVSAKALSFTFTTQFSSVHSSSFSSLQFSSFHSVHFSSFYFSSFSSLQFISFHFSSVQFTSVHFSSLQFIQFTSVQFSSLQFIQFTSVQFSSLQFTSFHCSSVQFIQFSSVHFSSFSSVVFCWRASFWHPFYVSPSLPVLSCLWMQHHLPNHVAF